MNNDHRVNVPCGKSGDWEISRFELKERHWGFELQGRGIPVGVQFTRLTRGRTCVMSDTPAEWRDHAHIYYQAKGRVLIAGLGIGMILNAIAEKPDVTHVTVIEKCPDVIKLSGPHYLSKFPGRVEIIQADILEWLPPKGMVYDVAWFDIWDYISADNYPDMKLLARRWGRKAVIKGFWAKPLVMRQVREDRERERMLSFFRERDRALDKLRGDLEGLKHDSNGATL